MFPWRINHEAMFFHGFLCNCLLSATVMKLTSPILNPFGWKANTTSNLDFTENLSIVLLNYYHPGPGTRKPILEVAPGLAALQEAGRQQSRAEH